MPFTVRAMTTAGSVRLSSDRARLRASRSALRGRGRRRNECPSRSSPICRSSGSMPMTSSTLPSSWYPLRSTIAISRPTLVMCGGQRGLPDLALLHLAIAEHDEDAEGPALHPAGQSHARARRRDAWPIEPEREVDARAPCAYRDGRRADCPGEYSRQGLPVGNSPNRRGRGTGRQRHGLCPSGSGRDPASAARRGEGASHRNRAPRKSPRPRKPRCSDRPWRSRSAATVSRRMNCARSRSRDTVSGSGA